MDIAWEHEGSMLRSTAAGEELVARGVLHHEYGDAEIRELAARPEYSGAFGRWDTANDPDEKVHTDAPGEVLVEEGISGSSRA